MANSVQVLSLPDCEIPLCSEIARYDAKTKSGPWANMCEAHFKQLGVGLGTGKGQMMALADESKLKSTMDNCEKEIANLRRNGRMRAKVTFTFLLDVDYSEEELKKGIEYQLSKFTPKSKKTKVLETGSNYEILADPPSEEDAAVAQSKRSKTEASAPAPEPEPAVEPESDPEPEEEAVVEDLGEDEVEDGDIEDLEDF